MSKTATVSTEDAIVTRDLPGADGLIKRGSRVDTSAWPNRPALLTQGFLRLLPVGSEAEEALKAARRAEIQAEKHAVGASARADQEAERERRAASDAARREADAAALDEIGPRICKWVAEYEETGNVLWAAPEADVDLAHRARGEMRADPRLTVEAAWAIVKARTLGVSA